MIWSSELAAATNSGMCFESKNQHSSQELNLENVTNMISKVIRKTQLLHTHLQSFLIRSAARLAGIAAGTQLGISFQGILQLHVLSWLGRWESLPVTARNQPQKTIVINANMEVVHQSTLEMLIFLYTLSSRFHFYSIWGVPCSAPTSVGCVCMVRQIHLISCRVISATSFPDFFSQREVLVHLKLLTVLTLSLTCLSLKRATSKVRHHQKF